MKDRIKEVRKNSGLTQTAFGEKLGVKGNTITNYETGLRTPTDAVIKAIQREFSVDETWLRTGEGEPYIRKTKNQEIALFLDGIFSLEDSNFKKRFISALSDMDDAGWDAIEKFIEKFK